MLGVTPLPCVLQGFITALLPPWKTGARLRRSSLDCATAPAKNSLDLLSNFCVCMDNERVNTEELDTLFHIYDKDTHGAPKGTVHGPGLGSNTKAWILAINYLERGKKTELSTND